MGELHRPTVAILASGSGSTAEAFIRATQISGIDAEVGLVVCNNPRSKVGIYDRVDVLNKQYGLDIETVEISGRSHPGGRVGRGQTLEESAAICALIDKSRFAHVALMGYMKQVRGDLVETYGWLPQYVSMYQGRMSNTHPGPLPETADTYGVHASERVLQLGMSVSRHTVHLVSDGIDTGPIIAQHDVAVLAGDSPQSLFDRVQVTEKQMLPIALDDFLRVQRNTYGTT